MIIFRKYFRNYSPIFLFHLVADINEDQVTQYALGMIQIPVFGGTFYPYGPA